MTLRQNLVTLVNSASIKKGVLYNNRPHTVVTSKTLPFDVVMNDILYTKEQILANYKKLDGTPAPLGHPKNAAGEFISAKSMEGVNLGHVGAWNRNPEIVGNRVQLETWIDEEVASRTAEGRELLQKIEKGEPISTSVAVLANKIEEKGRNYSAIAEIVDMDHNAILLHEPPAAGVDQGVGLLVNTECAKPAKDGDSLLKKLYNILKPLASNEGQNFIVNEEEEEVSLMEEQLKALLERVEALEKNLEEATAGKAEAEERVETLANQLKDVEARIVANENAKLEEKRAKVAKLLGNEEAAKDMSEVALDAIIAKSGKAHDLLPNSAETSKKDEGLIDPIEYAEQTWGAK